MPCCEQTKAPAEPVQQLARDAAPDPRTAKQPPVPPAKALEMMKTGNQRYVEGRVLQRGKGLELRSALASDGQNPMAAVVACADSRCPIEIVFDAGPGDLFVLRNAGNTCTHAEGSIVGSLEYCTGHLRTQLVLVLGHTKCGAIAGATKTMLDNKENPPTPPADGKKPTALATLLQSLTPVAEQAAKELPAGAGVAEIAAHAVKVNVIHTMDKLLEYSEGLRERVRNREVSVQGAIYDLDSGRVDFIGQSPNLGRIADSTAPPPAVTPRYSVQAAEESENPQEAAGPQEDPATPAGAVTPAKKSRWFPHLRK